MSTSILAPILLSLAGGYLVGSIPFGVIVSRLAGAPDPRGVGSGNIGATNVLRSGRRDLALATLIGDGGKGAVAALVAGALASPLAAAVAGAGAFLGHLFPVWLKLRGGKGVATFFGILLALAWPAGLICGALWIAVAAVFRLSSLAALVAAAASPVLVWAFDREGWPAIALAAGMAALIFLRHAGNIGRLARGEEPRIGARPANAGTAG